MNNSTLKKLESLIPTLKIPSVTRITLNRELKHQFKRLKKGIVLDVGSKHSPYMDKIPYTKYLRLDINKNSKPDICCDLHNIKWKSNYFDVIVATEVLEHLYDPKKAINEIYRVLKKGGICIMSTRFIYPYHQDPSDYYRYTWDSLNHLFKNFSKTEIYSHGNWFLSMWQIITATKLRVILNIFNPVVALFNFRGKIMPLGFMVYAKK